MIQTLQESDTMQVMEIWLGGNKDAHPFIPPEYWESHREMVREQLLQAKVYVYKTEGSIQGFIGLQDDSIAGIFVKPESRCAGIGKQLLDYVKKRHAALTLQVYTKNRRAVDFYKREGFSVIAEGTEEENGEAEKTMGWHRRE